MNKSREKTENAMTVHECLDREEGA